jgi:hypothetical protein
VTQEKLYTALRIESGDLHLTYTYNVKKKNGILVTQEEDGEINII